MLDDYLAALVGQRCLKARLSYGDELKLHFGDPQPVTNPKLASTQRGAWVLATRASAWRVYIKPLGQVPDADLQMGSKPPLDMATPESMASYADKLSGCEVVSAYATWWFHPPGMAPGLLLIFGDGSSFELAPIFAGDIIEGEEVADWELFTPHRMYLRVGPGPVWSNLRADVPAGVGVSGGPPNP